MNFPLVLLIIAAMAIHDCSADGTVLTCGDKDDNCAFTAAGANMKSCQFTKPMQVCLKDKEFLNINQKNFRWGSWSAFGIRCVAGVGARIASVDEDLRSFMQVSLSNRGSEVQAARIELSCPAAAGPADVAFAKGLESGRCKSLDALLSYLRQAPAEVRKAVAEAVSKS